MKQQVDGIGPMKPEILLFAVLASFAGRLQADIPGSPLPPGATETVNRYSEAFNRADCAEMLKLASPEINSRMQRAFGSLESYCNSIRSYHDQSVVERVQWSWGSWSQGPHRMAIVQTLRAPVREDVEIIGAEGLYVLYSFDGGERWHVLDNSCVNAKWLSIVYPPFDDGLWLPERIAAVIHREEL